MSGSSGPSHKQGLQRACESWTGENVMTLPMRRVRGGPLHRIEPTRMLRRDPFADVQELINRMTGLIQPVVEAEAERPWLPIAEIDEDDRGYVVRLELPGITPDEVDIAIRDR